ncbi:MAG TPA: hypothetical protein VH436_13140 [Vicinamibacterales bacterium]
MSQCVPQSTPDIDQVPLTDALRVVEEGLAIAPVETIVIMKLLA